MEDNKVIETDQTAALEDSEVADISLEPLAAKVMSDFYLAKTKKEPTEHRQMKMVKNFRAIYGDEEKFLDTERSRVFIKVTKTKALASYGQIMDILLGQDTIPISVEATPIPEEIEELAHISAERSLEGKEGEESIDPIGFPGDGNDLQEGEGLMDRTKRIVAQMYRDLKVEKGPAETPQDVTITPAAIAAAFANKKIQDQLIEGKAVHHLRKTLFEMVTIGTGVLKGPFHTLKEYPKWEEDGTYTPIIKVRPQLEYVSCWNFYPDPLARSVDEASFVVERHPDKSVYDIRKLKKQAFYRKDKIDEALALGPSTTKEWWEQDLKESNTTSISDRYELIEYWGIVDKELILADKSIELPESLKDSEEFSVNIVLCNGILLKVVVNPFKPVRIPYYAIPYEFDPYNFFGVGLPENMEDSQSLMNGFARMAVDNAVLAGNMMLEVDEDNLVPGQNMDIYAGKIWRRKRGATGNAIASIKFQNTFHENMQVYDKFRQLADDATGIPSFSHGQTGVSGIGRTASGISMLMGAASVSVKTVVKNIDDYLLKPLGDAYYAFNMQFDFDKRMLGDLVIKPMGLSSIVQKELMSQRLLQFMQVTSSDEEFRSYRNTEYVLQEFTKLIGLDPKAAINSPKVAAIRLAKIQKDTAQAAQQGQAQGAPSMDNEVGGGGGMMNIGSAPGPESEQFTGNNEGGSDEQS